MPSVSLAKPPDPYSCKICEKPALASKAGPACERCPAFRETHYFPRTFGPDAADLVVVGDVAQEPPDRKIERELERGIAAHEPFADDGSVVLQRAIDDAITRFLGAKAGVNVKYLYAIRCAADNPNKAVLTACQGPLQADLSRVNSERLRTGRTGKLVVIACGTIALRALGVHVTSFEDAAGHVFETSLGDVPVAIVPTLSLAALAAASGKYSSVLADVDRALRVLTNTQIQVVPRQTLEKGYHYPKTIEGLRRLVATVRDYAGPNSTPAKWAISLDTETNTLHPHRPTLKLLAVSFAWDTGAAAAVPLWHPGNTYYDPAEAWEVLRPLVEGDKPKILHNGKYDLKVFWRVGSDIGNMVWDCMLAEHALEEDKKGQYGLKYLVRQFLPSYSGYEDKLHDLLESYEGTDQRQSVDRELAARPLSETLPQPIAAALAQLDASPKFRVATMEKNLEVYRDALARGMPQEVVRDRGLAMEDRKLMLEARVRAAELLIAAKKAGEFSTAKKEKKADRRDEDGGFERIPLDELLFYAAVDADATRQLSVMQFARMWQEDQDLDAKRAELSFTMRRDPRLRRFAIVRRYDDAHPVAPDEKRPAPVPHLVKSAYVPRSRVLARMEYDGIRVDRDYLHDADVKLTQVIHDQEERIYELAGTRFNLGSTSQLGAFFFTTGVGYRHPDPERAARLAADAGNKGRVTWRGDHGRVMFEPESYTQRGAAQVNEATLKAYINKYECPLAEAVLLYRKATKAKETFLVNVDRLSKLDGFLHTSYNLHGTGTGRLSSTNLNMQNTPKGEMGAIPDKDPRARTMSKAERAGVKCKKLFVPHASDMVFVNCDAKGAEVSIFSGYAQDRALIEALRGGMDAHCFFSSKVLDPDKVAAGKTGEERRLALASAGIDDEHAWTYEDFLLGKDGLLPDAAYNKRLKKLRDNIKRVVFGILYGAGPGKIADIAGIDKEFAQTIIELLFGMFPSLPAFVEQVQFEVEHLGVVETYHGRRRRFAIKHAPPKLLAQAKRRGVNFEIQAENSDIVLDVLTRVAPIVERDMGGRVYLTVHDSIGFGVPFRYVTQVKEMMYREGTLRVAKDNPWLPVEYKWDCEYGWSYGTVATLDEFLASAPQVVAEDSGALVEEEILDELRSAVLEHAEQQ